MHCKALHLAALATLAIVGGFTPAALAVIIDDGADGSSNIAAPSGFPYWNNIVPDGVGTGIYMGNRWMLTASHVGANSVTFSGTTYSPVAGTVLRISNTNGTPTDLIVYRIDGDPNLPSMPIVSQSAGAWSAVTMIGDGRGRLPDLYGWDSSWQVTGTGSAARYAPYRGFYWSSDRAMRWGSNYIAGAGVSVDIGYGAVNTFSTQFQSYSAKDKVPFGHASDGDSGGPVFITSGTSWSLAGVMLYISSYSGQPGGTALYGNYTYAADLATYRSQLTPMDGDANNDGRVDMADYTIWFSNFGSTNAGWLQGDFNGDGKVDMADYVLWFSNFGLSVGGSSLGSFSVQDTSGVPEPATLAMLGAMALLINLRRPRR